MTHIILLSESKNDVKQLLTKEKEESDNAGLYLNVKKTKIRTTEEIYNFNTDNENIKIIKYSPCLSSVIHSKGDHSRDINRRLRFRKAAMAEIENTTKNKNMSLETKDETINTRLLPIYGQMQKWNNEEG